MKLFLTILTLSIVFSLTAQDEWMKKISRKHPRLFITQQEIPLLKKRAETVCKNDFEKIKKEVDALPDKAELIFYNNKFKLNPDGSIKYIKASQGMQLVKYTGAREAVKAAMIFLISNDHKYQVKAKNYLKMAVKFFKWCLEHKTMTAWYNVSRINTLTAYDWIYNSLTPEERREIIIPLLKYIDALQTAKFHRCTGNYNNGNYGVRSLLWFAGLAAYGDGIDDITAKRFLRQGYALHKKMMDYRDLISGGSGLLSASTAGYSFGAYPYASFMFLHSFKSATGEDISSRWKHMCDYPDWFNWASIPGEKYLLQYGIGDTPHNNNKFPTYFMYTHMAQSIHFYKDKYPETASTALALIEQLPEKDKHFSKWYPFLPFILFHFDPEEKAASRINKDDKKAKLFESFGLVIMRSGTGKNDTYCLFRAGSKYDNHQHYDENHFTIYKKDFLALDSANRTKSLHHSYYCPQSVAHNTILIHQQKEAMPYFWKAWGPAAEKNNGKVYYNHGGQYKKTEARRLAFKSGKFYTYVANDAGKAYHPAKCAEAVRQFVFIYPDYFIVYDRVRSIKASQRKEWLLHTQNKLKKVDNTYYQTDNNGGRLFCRTLLPENAIQQEVGGPGKQFTASGRNWPLPGGEKAFDKKNSYGQWRLEVRSRKPQKSVRFLHLLQAGTNETAKMISSKLKQTASQDGIELIDRQGNKWEVLFNRSDKVGATIRAWDKNSKQLLSNSL